MKRSLIFLTIALLVSTGNAQVYEWTKTFGGTEDVYAESITLDENGNVYTAGYFEGIVDFDPSTGVDNHTSSGGRDVFVQKMDANGNFIWAKTFGGTDNTFDILLSIIIDGSGDIYTAGVFQETVDFDPSEGMDNHTSNGNDDIFVQKMDADGNFLWAKTFGGTSAEIGSCITIDESGNVYTSGRFNRTVDFDPSEGIDNHTSNGSGSDIFIHKMDIDGNFVWAKTFEGSGTDLAYSMTVDDSGNLYTTGFYNGTVDFDPSEGIDKHTSKSNSTVFINKMDESGNYLWARTIGGSSNDEGNSIKVDRYGNVYLTGIFQETVDFDPSQVMDNHTSSGGYDIFIQKMSDPVLGITGNTFNNELQIYPNPTSGDFTIELGASYEPSKVSITDVMGRLIYSTKLSRTQHLNLFIDEPKGMYYVILESDNKKSIFKLIKE